MINWISGGRPDHPLADPRRARDLIAGLPSFDPPKALDEIRDWVESVLGTEGFRFDDRLGLVKLLDEAGQQYQRKLLRDYLAGSRLQKFQENRMWNAACSFWRELTAAYARCVEEMRNGARPASRSLLPLVACRGLRAAAQQLKWMQLRYGPIEEAAWAAVSDFYRFAVERQVEREAVELYPGAAASTSAERELLKVLMLWATPLDTLAPEMVELAERLTGHFSPLFVLEGQPGGYASHAHDLGGHRSPLRVAVAPAAGSGLVYFGAGAAPGQIEGMRRTLAKGVVPEELGLGTTYKPAAVDDALAHLAEHWSATPPGRRHNRLKVQTRLAVIHGFDRMVDELGGDGSLNFEGIESWVVEDISAGGFGAVISQARPEWVRIGSLVGTRPEGVARWGLGVVRRLKRDVQGTGHVGVETLAREVVPVRLRATTAGWAGSGAVETEGNFPGLWLGASGAAPGEVLLVLPGGRFSPRESLEMLRQGGNFLLIPVQLRERGEHHDIACFREMLRE